MHADFLTDADIELIFETHDAIEARRADLLADELLLDDIDRDLEEC